MTTAEKHAALFAGRWVGETQGYSALAHLWEITQQGIQLLIDTRWEGEARSTRLRAKALADEPAFLLGTTRAVLLTPQHFVIPGWDTNDTRGHSGPNYDVVFSRPGLAELRSTEVWEAFKASQS
jgi:hypothetical protein